MKTIRKFSLVLLSMVLLFTLTSCDETGAVSVDTAKVEKSVLSVMNTALGTDFTNDEACGAKRIIFGIRSIKMDESSGHNPYTTPKAKTGKGSG